MRLSTHNQSIHKELDTLLREGLLDQATYQQLSRRYPTKGWNWHSLGRWFLIFGTISIMAGLAVLARTFFEFTLEKLAFILVVLLISNFSAAQWLKYKYSTLVWTTLSLELLGGLCVIGLTFTLAAIYSTGSGNWPALLLIDLILLLGLSYGFRNPLLLVLSIVVFFSWFGGFTGYASGWGTYWFGMNYPLRFLAAATIMIVFAIIHQQSEKGFLTFYRGFCKIWLSGGLFFAEMALWLLSLFGNFNLNEGWYGTSNAELILFNILWVILNGILIWLGTKRAMRMLTGYGTTFSIIQIYTLFFAHLAGSLGLFLSLLITGGSALALTFYLERRQQCEQSIPPDGKN